MYTFYMIGMVYNNGNQSEPKGDTANGEPSS